MDDRTAMSRAVELASSVRGSAHPNPWVGALLDRFQGATEPWGQDGSRHAEAVVLDEASAAARGGTLYVTLEPCAEFPGKRTPACAQRIVDAGIERVVVGIEDPDERVRGRGIAALRAAGVDVEVGVLADDIRDQLAPYIHHRTTGRPYVVLKLAATLDGRIAAPDGSSQWITGEAARADAHRLRADSDAVLVGAGTVRADDPSLTVRLVGGRDPRRVVLGSVDDPAAKVHPCDEVSGDLDDVLAQLGKEGAVQLLVEGGAKVAAEFHRRGLVNRYVLYLAPALFGGDDARPMFAGSGASTIADVWRGRVVDVKRFDPDLRIDLVGVS